MKNAKNNTMRHTFIYILLTITMLLSATGVAYAWINGIGSPSVDPDHPAIGTHDRMLNTAISMLPNELQSKIDEVAADYGSEMPDYNSTECNCTNGIGDKKYHQVYYRKDGTIREDSSARRAQEEYALAMSNLRDGDKYNFSIHVGMMSHYMADVSAFVHTMGPSSDWGDEGPAVHSAYENLVASAYGKFFSNKNIKFDGVYNNITAYSATLDSANDTTFDNKFGNGTRTNVWMYNIVNSSINSSVDNSTNLTYASANPDLITRTSQSLNYSINLMADVMYVMVTSNVTTSPIPVPTLVDTYLPPGGTTAQWKAGVIKAMDDYFAAHSLITKADLLIVMDAYFGK